MRKLEQIKEDFIKQKEIANIKTELLVSGKTRKRYNVEEMARW